MSKRSGSGKNSGSRFAPANIPRTMAFLGIVLPPNSAASCKIRKVAGIGPSQRKHSSTALSPSAGFARSLASSAQSELYHTRDVLYIKIVIVKARLDLATHRLKLVGEALFENHTS